MKASKLYQIFALNGEGFNKEECSLDEYIDNLRAASDVIPEIENMIFETGLHALKKYLKKTYELSGKLYNAELSEITDF